VSNNSFYILAWRLINLRLIFVLWLYMEAWNSSFSAWKNCITIYVILAAMRIWGAGFVHMLHRYIRVDIGRIYIYIGYVRIYILYLEMLLSYSYLIYILWYPHDIYMNITDIQPVVFDTHTSMTYVDIIKSRS